MIEIFRLMPEEKKIDTHILEPVEQRLMDDDVRLVQILTRIFFPFFLTSSVGGGRKLGHLRYHPK